MADFPTARGLGVIDDSGLSQITHVASKEILGRTFMATSDSDLWRGLTGLSGFGGQKLKGKAKAGMAFGSQFIDDNARHSGKAIDVAFNIKTQTGENGVSFVLPIHRSLHGVPFFGDNSDAGTEKEITTYFQEMRLSPSQASVVVKRGLMDELMQDSMGQYKDTLWNYVGQLSDFWAAYFEWTLRKTLLDGMHRGGISFDSTTYGSVVEKWSSNRSHPNFLIMNGTEPTYSDTVSTYESNVSNALGSLVDSSDMYFSTETIRQMVAEAWRKHITPVTLGNGRPAHIIVITPEQFIQLSRDEQWNKQIYAASADINNRVIEGTAGGYMYQGAYLVIDPLGAKALISGQDGYDDNGFTVQYGCESDVRYDQPQYNPNTGAKITQSNKSPYSIAMLLGQGAMLGGIGRPLQTMFRKDDVSHQDQLHSNMIFGMSRTDVRDKDRTFYTNDTSLVCATYSPA